MRMSWKVLVAAAFVLAVPLFVFAQGTGTSTPYDLIQNQINALPKNAPPALRDMLLKQAAQMKSMSDLRAGTISPELLRFPENTENCFNLFHFGSVQVNVSPTRSDNIPGKPVTFVGTLENKNTYPIVGGAVYVKIFRTDGSDSKAMHLNGYPIVDQFIAKKDISIDTNTNQPFQFSWNIPEQLASGEYQAAFYFVGNNRFNIMGLSFSDDVSGNKTPFSVKNTSVASVASFDKNSVTANGQPYYFAQPPLVFGQDEVVKIQAKIMNPSTESKTITVKQSTYNWDSQRPESLLEEQEQSIMLGPKETKVYEYDESKHTGTVTLVVLTLTDNGVKSVLNVRFARPGANETRLSFSSITEFPIEKGKQNTLFTCTHSTFGNAVDGQEITLTLTDVSGNIIDTYTYTGKIVSSMMAVKNIFTPTMNSNNFTLTASLKNNGRLVDTFTETYDCAQINLALCTAPLPWKEIAGGVISLLILFGGGWWFLRKRHKEYEQI